MRRLAWMGLAATAWASTAVAAVPVNDGSLLAKRTEDSSVKVQIKGIRDQVSKSVGGIHCSYTTPKRDSSVQNPTKAIDRESGASAIRNADPTMASGPAFSAGASGSAGSGRAASGGGGIAGNKAQLDQTGSVAGGIMTSQDSAASNKAVWASMSQGIGSDSTLMESMDRNSALRTQGGLTFNQALQAASLLAQAYNVVNIGTMTLASQGSHALAVPTPPGISASTRAACPAGMTGDGTRVSPCVAAACSTTGFGPVPAPGCVIQRFTDPNGVVSYALMQVQARALATQPALSSEELMASLNQYQQ